MMKKNVLFILADDQRFDTIHALGNKEIKTPNLDKLVESGTAFTHAHIPGGTSGAVCMPSRAMLNSGKTLFHLYEEGQQIPKTDTTMGQCFKDNGYRTIGIGKWHNGTESYTRSFSDGDSIFFGGMWDHWNVPVCQHHADGIYQKTTKVTANFMKANHPMEVLCDKLSTGVHSTDLFTNTAIDFLNQKQEKPFFLYLSYLAPHDPRTMPDEFQNMYKPEDITLPENFMSRQEFPFGVGDTEETRSQVRDEALAKYPREEAEVLQHICDYYAMISHIDYNVGKLVETLKDTNQLENTIIVFVADNGLAIGRHGFMGKQNLYDHSVRVPLIVSGAGIEKNKKTDDYVYLLDIFPTLCELNGLAVPNSVEGKSFMPALTSEESSGREDLFFAYTGLARSVKTKQFKLIEYKNARENSQLFDLKSDPNELKNLFNESAYQLVVADLQQRLLSYKDTWEDNQSNPHTGDFWNHVTL